jgi:hypothetical protein
MKDTSKNNVIKNIFESIKPYFKRYWLRVTVYSLHSLWLILITFWLLEQNITYGDEGFLAKWSTVIKKVLLKIDKKPQRSELLFINCSYDNALTSLNDENGFEIGNQVITDRKKLARLFEIMNNNPDNQKYVLCDIFFKDPSENDSILNSQISKVKNIIVPYHLDNNNVSTQPIFKVNKGLADYKIIELSFLKYSLFEYDTLKSIALKMYEDIFSIKSYRYGLLNNVGGKLSFNTLFIDYKVRYYDILEGQSDEPYPYVNLGEFISLPDSIITATMKNRIIIIGDMKTIDMHQTVIGKIPGPLILLNVYLMLANNEHVIYNFFIFILFAGYFLITMELFGTRKIKETGIVKKLTETRARKFVYKYFSYVFYLTIISIVTYSLYNIHINILLIAVYLKLTESAVNRIRHKKQKRILNQLI